MSTGLVFGECLYILDMPLYTYDLSSGFFKILYKYVFESASKQLLRIGDID
jgi:hypothetical protein